MPENGIISGEFFSVPAWVDGCHQLCHPARHLEIMPVTLSPSLPLRCAQGFGSLKGKLREGSLVRGAEMLPLRYAQGFGSLAQHDRTNGGR